MVSLGEGPMFKAPTHYAPYGARCRVDRNVSIKTQNLAFCKVTKLIFDIARQNVCLSLKKKTVLENDLV